ncbi:hypothetical protein FP359_24375 [Klebsiella variicola]|uniref:type 4b pilus protein PilO2 n=1 Tax=Klebsiella variicola TaxID=244366 RepID=UPI001C984D24|nr:type 4b pilus protein PilO2 [Klebsiella variicola]MBY5172986.1 hypothetical protein [Klebsiella variicola]
MLIHVLPHDNGGLVAGLQWEAVPAGGKRPGQGTQRLSLTLRPPRRRKNASREHAGPVTGHCPWQRGRLWSLAALAIAWTGENGYGVVQLSDDDNPVCVFLATRHGLPALYGDICGTRDEMEKLVSGFLALTPPPPEGWHVAATPQAPARPADVLPARRGDWKAVCRLTCPARQKRALAILVPLLATLLTATVWGVKTWQTWMQTQTQEARGRLSVLGAGEKPVEIRYLPHPWATRPAATTLIQVCESTLTALPRRLGGWQRTEADCRADGVITQWVRPALTGVTVETFLHAAGQPTVSPAVVIDDAGNSAQVAFAHLSALPPGGDETVPEAEQQRRYLLTFFQSRGMPPALRPVPPAPVPVEEGVRWIQDWQTLAFSHTAPRPPSQVLAGLLTDGLRLTRVSVKTQGTATIWSWEADAYSRDPDSYRARGEQEEQGTPP